ncbi:forkhead box protein J1-A [Silurus asotus]|uniref:Forkhead box protein J1-A n=1 Tax=Silurus asotus TaxID=30991 RepID=A0AAD5B539_SILAS|nr:forkhead box protein J1-A [Silurus asotus]
MLSINILESWAKGSVVLDKEVLSPVTKAKELIESSSFNCSSSDNMDDSLTNLQWLQEFSIRNTSGGQYVISNNQHQSKLYEQHLHGDAPASPLEGDLACICMPLTPGKPTATALCSLPSMAEYGYCAEEIDYKTNPHIKPPYSYATLICLAMQASKKSKITLSDIYTWITDNFCYFRHAEPTWQNSIRHNLSLNKCFIKVPRQKDEPGKGGYWKIDPEYAQRLLNGAYKKRGMPPVQINPTLKNQLRMSSQPETVPETVPTNISDALHSNHNSKQLLEEFENINGHDPNLADTTLFDTRSAVKGSKRKYTYDLWNSVAKSPSCSESTLEEPKVLESLEGNFDWEALLNSVMNGDFSLDEGVPLSPIPQDEDLMAHGIHVNPLEAFVSSAESSLLMETQRDSDVNVDKETFFATDFLQNPWSEEENRPDLLCISNADVNQLFDVEHSFSDDFDSTILTLL